MVVNTRSNVRGMFHRSLSLLILAGTMIGCIEQKPQAPKGGKPRIEIVGGETIDWGRTGPGTLKRTVKITNTGGDTLRISNVRPSCGCTTAPLDKQVIGPGDTASMDVAIDMKTKSGPQSKTILVMSNDSTRANLNIVLKADIMREIVASPDIFPLIGDIKAGEEGTSKIEIINTGEEPVTVQPPTIPNPPGMLVQFDMKESVTLAPSQKVEIVAHARPIRQGMTQAEVLIRTTSKINPELTVSLTCNAN